MLAGSDRFGGAVVLATGGAVRGGAGMVRVVTAPVPVGAVRQAWPEAVLTTYPDDPGWDLLGSVGRVQAWVAGPGMGTGPDAVARLTAILRTDLPVLVDADGLTIVSQHPGLLPRQAPTLITPHAGGTGPAARHRSGRHRGPAAGTRPRRGGAARRDRPAQGIDHGGGGRRGGPVFVNPTGTPWLATAGTGDVLSGLAGALLAQGLAPAQAGITAAYLHGLAARLAAAGPGLPGLARGGSRRARRERGGRGPDRRPRRHHGAAGRHPQRGGGMSDAMDRQAIVDLAAIRGNVAALREHVRGSEVMAVVKADGYGHGMVPAARAALAGGASWLGTADLTEALGLRAAGITAPVLCLMAVGEPAEAIRAGIDITAGSAAYLGRVRDAAARAGVPARLHLKVDTGLSRGGATRADWPGLVDAALAAQAAGALRVVGLWSTSPAPTCPGTRR